MNIVFPETDDSLEVILKVTGDVCNINCHYCYEKRKPKDNNHFLSLDTVRAFLEKAGGRPLSIGIHGGEPTLYGLERMKALLDLLYYEYSGAVEVKVQTNGTLLDDNWVALFGSYANLTIGISLDGDRGVNAHRVNYRNESTNSPIEDTLRRLTDSGVDVGIISVVTALSLGKEKEILDYFSGFSCVKALNFAPCFDYNAVSPITKGKSNIVIHRLNSGSGLPAWAITPNQFGAFLDTVYEHWKTGYYESFTVEPLLSIMRVLSKAQPDSCHFTREKCAFVLTIYPDGRIGTCDEISSVPTRLGEVHTMGELDDMLHMKTNPALQAGLSGVLQDCEGCDYQDTCGGGCLATRMRYRNTPLYQEYCDYRMAIIDRVRADLVEMQVI